MGLFGKHQHNNNINNINNNNIIIIINHKTKQHISTTQWKWKTKHLIYSASCFLKRPSYTASPIMRKNTNWQMRVPGTSASGWLDALKISKTWRLLMPGFMKPAVMCTNNYDCCWWCTCDNQLILALCIIKNKKKKKITPSRAKRDRPSNNPHKFPLNCIDSSVMPKQAQPGNNKYFSPSFKTTFSVIVLFVFVEKKKFIIINFKIIIFMYFQKIEHKACLTNTKIWKKHFFFGFFFFFYCIINIFINIQHI